MSVDLPLFSDFSSLKTTMITAVATLTSLNEYLNLPAIFAFLPVKEVDTSVQWPKGKVRYPSEWNFPGEIISMSYGEAVRGVRKPGRKRVFRNCISIDIGTTKRIVNIMLFSTMKIAGAPNMAIVKEATESLLSILERSQKRIGKGQYSENEKENQALKNLIENSDFNGKLYEGALEIEKYQIHLINRVFDIGRKIHRKNFSLLFNKSPFTCITSNVIQQRKLIIHHHFLKKDFDDHRSGKRRSYTFSVANTGTVNISGCSLENMEILYNTFILRLIQNYSDITLNESRILYLPTRSEKTKEELIIPRDEWCRKRKREFLFTSSLLLGRLPIYEKQFTNHSMILLPSSPLFDLIENTSSNFTSENESEYESDSSEDE